MCQCKIDSYFTNKGASILLLSAPKNPPSSHGTQPVELGWNVTQVHSQLEWTEQYY